VIDCMQSVSLNDRQSWELCDEIGNILTAQLDTDAVRNKVDRSIADYVKRNNLNLDNKDLSRNIEWSVKVSLKR
jgi:hypothetical protein